jgi:hypothetical protein
MIDPPPHVNICLAKDTQRTDTSERERHSCMTTIIERTEGHSDAHEETPYGTTYAWCPGRIVAECDCGERLSLTPFESICRCGAEHAGMLREEPATRRLSDEALPP